MTQSDVEKRTGCLEESTRWFERLASGRIEAIETAMAEEVQSYRERTYISVSTTTFSLIPYTQRLYLSACYHVMRSYGWGSPSLLALLAALWSAVKAIWKFISWLVEFIHLRDIITAASILRTIWPWFRRQMDIVYARVSDFSEKIGWGVDGVIHLLQATAQGMNVVAGLMGKDWVWLDTEKGKRVMDALRDISTHAKMIEEDPGVLLDYIYSSGSHKNKEQATLWWQKTSTWIRGIEDNARKAITGISQAVGEVEKIRNEMPSFVRKHIPQAIWNGIDYARTLLDERIPATFEKIDHSISEINAALGSERSKAASLVDELTRPGDVLLKIDALTPEGRADQEAKIDDATSRRYEEEVAKYDKEDTELLRYFEMLEKLAKAPIPEPTFLSIEEKPYKRPAYPEVTVYDTWFVGDF